MLKQQEGSDIIEKLMAEMTERIGGDGGAIALDTKGSVAVGFNSERMAWAYAILNDRYASSVQVHSGCNRDDHYITDLPLA